MGAFERDNSRNIDVFLRADSNSRKEEVSTSKSKDCIARHFGERKPSIGGAWHDSTDQSYYASDWFKHYQKMAQPFPKSRKPWHMDLADVLHSEDIEKIKASKQIRFHSCGDTGQAVVTALSNEGAVADMMVDDLSQDNPPAFFFHLGGLWPDAVLSGHAHHYERFTRIVNDKKIPYVISGSGGYNSLAQPANTRKYPYQVTGMTGVTLENILAEYGYLDIVSNAEKRTLSITFNSTNTKLGKSGVGVDSVVVQW